VPRVIDREHWPPAVVRAVEDGEAAASVAGCWADQYGVYADLAPEVRYSPELSTFLRGCQATNRFAVLLTDPDAALSPFVVGALRDHQAYWVLHRGDGPVVDGRTGTALSSYEQLWREPAPAPVLAPQGQVTVLAFDVVAEHRAEGRTEIGPLAADMLRLLGGGTPQVWGGFEPLAHPFDVGAITQVAREQMPDCDPILMRDARGSWLETVVSRTGSGLRERLRGGVVQDSDELAQVRGVESLAAIAEFQHRVLTAAVSALRPAAGPVWRPGPEHAEHLVAAYLGPAGLGRTGARPSEVANRCGGRLVGRTRVPGVLVELTGSAQERADAYLELIRDVEHEGKDRHVAVGA
jgi:hypothetical protein